jgi:aldose 1-epimerase
MSFIVDRCKEEELSLVRLQDTVSETIITVLPAFGALLHEFEIPLKGLRFNIIDNYTGKEDVEKNINLSFKSSKLSPFACRIKDGHYHFRGRDFEFRKRFSDGSAIHGLLYDKPFNITDQFADDMMASVVLRCRYRKEDPGYPFEYVCEVRYILHPQQTLQVETTVLNLDENPIPIADGWHPYFQLGNSIDEYELQFSSGNMLEFSNELIPTGHLLPETSFTSPVIIGNRMLDNCFLLEAAEGAPCCILRNPNSGLTLSFFTNAGYPYLQIFTPDHRKSIAIENLSGAPDCFNNGLGLLMLPPRHSHTFNVWYRLGMA